MSEEQNGGVSEKEYAQLKCMIRGAAELSEKFERFSVQTASAQLRVEFEKLAAASRNHISDINAALGGKNG